LQVKKSYEEIRSVHVLEHHQISRFVCMSETCRHELESHHGAGPVWIGGRAQLMRVAARLGDGSVPEWSMWSRHSWEGAKLERRRYDSAPDSGIRSTMAGIGRRQRESSVGSKIRSAAGR
jgi:hypothetical protein